MKEQDAATHTPLPWENSQSHKRVIYSQCIPIVHCGTGNDMDWLPGKRFLYETNAEANAALIVESVNSFASLKARVEKLEGVLRQVVNHFVPDGCHLRPEIVKQARAALTEREKGETK